MRTIKKHGDRKAEILDASQKLFYKKGYENSTINDILKSIGIAKGTFYHYFESKEEVLDEIINRYRDIIVKRAEKVIYSDADPTEKLIGVFAAMQIKDQVDDAMLDDLHRAENILLHHKILNQLVRSVAPILVKVIEEGVKKKIWSCRYPQEYMQIFLAASLSLTDEGIFEMEEDAQMKIMAALISMLEKMLEVPEDSFMKEFINRRTE